MQTSIEPVLDDFWAHEAGLWHKQSWVDFWRWGFSDLRDDSMKDTLADVMAKVLLNWGPAAMTENEREIFRISSLVAANGRPGEESARGYDA